LISSFYLLVGFDALQESAFSAVLFYKFSKTQRSVSINRKKAGKEHERTEQLLIRSIKIVTVHLHSYSWKIG